MSVIAFVTDKLFEYYCTNCVYSGKVEPMNRSFFPIVDRKDLLHEYQKCSECGKEIVSHTLDDYTDKF